MELIPDQRAESVCPEQLDRYYPDRDPYIDQDRVEPTGRMTNRRDDRGTTHVVATGDDYMTLDGPGRDPAFYMTLDTPARNPTSNARMSEVRRNSEDPKLLITTIDVSACLHNNNKWGAVASRSECRTLNRENPVSNTLAAVSKLWQFRSSHFATVHSAA